MSTAGIGKMAIAAAAVCLFAIGGFRSSVSIDASSRMDESLSQARSVEWYESRPGVMRARLDAARGRIWTLHVNGVDVYDARSDTKLRSISLPEWVWAGALHSCRPDLAVGPNGDVLVSSNVIPVIWRIDAASFLVTQHELELDDKYKGRDVGFSGMTYSAQQGAFLAISGPDGSLWRIDPLLRRAQNIPLSSLMPGACALSQKAGAAGKSRSGALCVQTEDSQWTVHLAPDYRSGYAHPEACSPDSLASRAKLRRTF
jgi:hypothetical protein